jgi:hypothetical protein
MTRAILLAATLILSTHLAHGRLGETVGELEARYGHSIQTVEPLPGEESVAFYKYQDFGIKVTFVNGKSAQEIYIHQDRKTPLSEREIQSFLDLNSMGERWEKSSKHWFAKIEADEIGWRLGGPDPKDWVALAVYFPKPLGDVAPWLSVETIEYARKHRPISSNQSMKPRPQTK